jgi:hypothetical protein
MIRLFILAGTVFLIGLIVKTPWFKGWICELQVNAENLLVIQEVQIAERCARNWREHLEHSVPYERKEKTASP